MLKETAIEPVEAKMPRPTADQVITQLIAAQRICNRSGTTSTIDAALSEEQISDLHDGGRATARDVRTGLERVVVSCFGYHS